MVRVMLYCCRTGGQMQKLLNKDKFNIFRELIHSEEEMLFYSSVKATGECIVNMKRTESI